MSKRSKPASLFMGRIRCDSEADSIVWMGEDGGSARFEMNIFKRLFDLSVKQPRFFNKAGFCLGQGKEPFLFS